MIPSGGAHHRLPARPYVGIGESRTNVVVDRPVTLVIPGRGSGRRLGPPMLMDVVKLAVDRCLALQVLAMQSLDQLTGWPSALVVGVMAIAKLELAACRGMLPDSPAARLVTVVLLDQLVNAAPIAPRIPNS
jgi:hypothetical protein